MVHEGSAGRRAFWRVKFVGPKLAIAIFSLLFIRNLSIYLSSSRATAFVRQDTCPTADAGGEVGLGVFQSRCLLHAVIVWFVPGGGGPAIVLSPKGRMWWPIFATVSTHFPSPFRVFEFGWLNLFQGNSNQLVFFPMDLWDSISLGCLIFFKETEISLLGWYPVCVFSPMGFWDSVSLGCLIFFKETEISFLGWYPVFVFFPMGFCETQIGLATVLWWRHEVMIDDGGGTVQWCEQTGKFFLLNIGEPRRS
jgi:hypothetical protein